MGVSFFLILDILTTGTNAGRLASAGHDGSQRCCSCSETSPAKYSLVSCSSATDPSICSSDCAAARQLEPMNPRV